MRKTLKWTAIVLGIALIGTIGFFAYSFVDFANGIHTDSKDSKFFANVPSASPTAPPKWEGKEQVNILLMGGDSRESNNHEPPRSDTMMLASIDPVTKKAYLFSILRDSYVKIPGHGSDRINAALAYGGPSLTMQTVSEMTGLPIQYYVYTDFEGFVALVNAVGGVEIDVEKDMKYTDKWDGPEFDIDLKKGLQTLDGKTALQYVRFRHDKLGDFTRTERQRKFMTALAQKMQRTTSLVRLPSILNKVEPYIETNMPMTDMLKLGSLAYDAKTEGLVTEQIPPAPLVQEKRIGGADVIGFNQKQLQTYLKELLAGGTPGSPNPSGSSGSSTGIKNPTPSPRR
ncbi:transcriptional regulator [Paenibacillus sp. J31TS4]|uniref:LCP family protein n=1 Tax=Paenibacillus sp. J31TS4 TaxID=2807195 RepID=UPI001B0B2D8A|nr:LCP family protein [Paenibacillus sp. J31TS4]GIP41115.1 transcriptional regulator [Paenibacillus sp. J31TS4]